MKPVILLVDETEELNYGGKRIERDFYEMEYKDAFTEIDVEVALKNHFDDVEVEYLSGAGVSFKLKGKSEFFLIETALKIGDKYYKLSEFEHIENIEV